MRPYRIFAIGEVLWDMLPTGKKVGGAPGNFACHCRKQGADADVISRVGDDALGHELLAFYRSVGLSTNHIAVDPDHPTGAVDVELDADGQPRYVFRDDVAWDHLQADDGTLALLQTTDAICYGTLAGRRAESLRTLQTMIAAPPETTLRVFDVNFRAPHYTKETVLTLLPSANILKLNDEELPILGQMLGQTTTDPVVLARWLIDHYRFKLLALTRGEHGSLLLTANDMSGYRSRPVQVADTVGAGDAFTAATVIGFLDGRPLGEINRTASDLAAHVCTYPGAMTP
ncbi:MAG: carbohydrate kinase [Planctomycetaceae bacterium]|nr:carbohydrate kinase [Planctomycetaceae bacterium]